MSKDYTTDRETFKSEHDPGAITATRRGARGVKFGVVGDDPEERGFPRDVASCTLSPSAARKLARFILACPVTVSEDSGVKAWTFGPGGPRWEYGTAYGELRFSARPGQRFEIVAILDEDSSADAIMGAVIDTLNALGVDPIDLEPER